jgi:S1-C subfamily serine protease
MEEIKKREDGSNTYSDGFINNEDKTRKIKNMDKKFFQMFVLIAIVSSVFGASFGFLSGKISTEYFGEKENQKNSNNESIKIVESKESAVISTVEKATPGVVSIVVSKDVSKLRNFFDDPFAFGPFFYPFDNKNDSGSMERMEIGGGSGFIVATDGTIVTNKHVVSDEDADYTVITSDAEEHKADVIARHPTMDIALLKIEGSNFSAIELGESDNLKVGQSVIAIGNPLGEFSNSASLGIISGLKRDIVAGSGMGDSEKLMGIIQTDAAINPGNSGGPLLDISGKVIGINVAVAQGAENIGFALPINLVKNTIEQVKNSGKISVPFLGVRYAIVTESIQKENNLPFEYGALVIRGEKITDLAVTPASPADKVGIVENDIILEIAGEKITEKKTLSDLISQHEVGEDVAVKVWHKGEIKEIQIKLEERK